MFTKLDVIRKFIKRKLIHYGLVKKNKFLVNNNLIILGNLHESNILQEIALNGFESYENEVVTLIKNYPWCMTAFFDIGANFGFYSILTEMYYPNMKVVAVEPFPKNIEYIKKIKNNNALNFELVEKAVDKSDGEKKIFYFPTSKSSSKLSATASLYNSFKGTDGVFNDLEYETMEVMTTTLDSIVSQYNINDSCLIKLDCEGNELSILESSTKLLEKDEVDFIIEIMINDSDKQDVFTKMKEHGYNAFLITNAGLVLEDRPLTFPNPTRKSRTLWKNHFFTKKDIKEVRKLSEKSYGYWI